MVLGLDALNQRSPGFRVKAGMTKIRQLRADIVLRADYIGFPSTG
jgi:hypothetical protein